MLGHSCSTKKLLLCGFTQRLDPTHVEVLFSDKSAYLPWSTPFGRPMVTSGIFDNQPCACVFFWEREPFLFWGREPLFWERKPKGKLSIWGVLPMWISMALRQVVTLCKMLIDAFSTHSTKSQGVVVLSRPQSQGERVLQHRVIRSHSGASEH